MNVDALTDDQLRDLMSECAAEWTARFHGNPKMLRVQFPYGQIRPLGVIQQRWPFLPSEDARNIACTIQLCDVNSWFLNTWKISLTAGSEWEWQCTLPVVAVMEALLHGYGIKLGIFKHGTQFKKCINRFHNASIISNHLRDELHIHRNRRNDVHLFLKAKIGNHDDKPARYNQAVRTLRKLERVLLDDWGKRNA